MTRIWNSQRHNDQHSDYAQCDANAGDNRDYIEANYGDGAGDWVIGAGTGGVEEPWLQAEGVNWYACDLKVNAQCQDGD